MVVRPEAGDHAIDSVDIDSEAAILHFQDVLRNQPVIAVLIIGKQSAHLQAVSGVDHGKRHMVDEEGVLEVPGEIDQTPALVDAVGNRGEQDPRLHVAPIKGHRADVGIRLGVS